MTVPVVFRKSTGRVLANYNYIDLASGTGYVLYYAGHNYNTALTDNYILESAKFYSQQMCTPSATNNATSATKMLDLDFDIYFNKPQTVRGTAVISVPWSTHTNVTGADTITTYLVVRIRKWDGVAETEIEGRQSDTWVTASGVPTYDFIRGTVPIAIPQTLFKAGETLRVTIELWGSCTNSGEAHHYAIGHDPKGLLNNDWTGWTAWEANVGTILEVRIPYKIQT